MPEYILSVWHDDDYADNDFNDPDMQRLFGQVNAFNEKLTAAGSWVYGNGLKPASSATTFRYGDGQVSMTDGPFAESKEQMGGFWVIEAPDMDAALDWARQAAAACEGNIEVRPTEGA